MHYTRCCIAFGAIAFPEEAVYQNRLFIFLPDFSAGCRSGHNPALPSDAPELSAFALRRSSCRSLLRRSVSAPAACPSRSGSMGFSPHPFLPPFFSLKSHSEGFEPSLLRGRAACLVSAVPALSFAGPPFIAEAVSAQIYVSRGGVSVRPPPSSHDQEHCPGQMLRKGVEPFGAKSLLLKCFHR